MKEDFGLLGGFVQVAALLWYAWNLYRGKAGTVNPMSMLMWLAIDVVLLVVTIDAGKPIWLPLGYTIGTAGIVFALAFKAKWTVGLFEFGCFVGAAVAAYLWRTEGSAWGLGMGVAALTIAGLPAAWDMVKEPVPSSWYLWAFTAVAGVCTLLGSDGSFEGTVIAWGGIVYNIPMTYLARRGSW